MQLITNYIKKLNIPKNLWLLVMLAAIFRLWGIWYGLPLQINVDEPSIISATSSLKNNNFNPERFDWPSLYFYITAVAYFIYAVLRNILNSLFALPEYFYTAAPLFVVSRFMSAVFGALTLIPVFIISRKIFNTQSAYIAALILLVLPVHLFESHFAKIDIAHTFFVSIAVYWIYNIYKHGDRKSFIWAGIWIGVATSIKYNAGLLFVPALIAYLMRRFEVSDMPWYKKVWIDKPNFINFIYSGLVSIIAFYIGSPYAAIDYKRFFSTEYGIGAMWQFQNVGKVEALHYPGALANTVWNMYHHDLGFWLWILLLILFVLFIFFNKRSKPYVFLMLPTVLFTLYISALDRSPSHYFLMLIPFYVPALAGFLSEIYDYLAKVSYENGFIKDKKLVLFILIVVILSPSFLASLLYNIKFGRADTRNIAYDWIQENLTDEDPLILYGDEINTIIFKEQNSKRVPKVNLDELGKQRTPFYLMISSAEVKKEELTRGRYDSEAISGDSSPFLEDADLLLYTDNNFRYGLPIYILRINSFTDED